MERKLEKSLNKNVNSFNELLGAQDSFDIIQRKFKMGGREACFYFVDGFAKDEVLQKIMQYLEDKKPEDIPKNIEEISNQLIPYGEVDLRNQLDDMCKDLLSGISILLIDGFDWAIAMDSRTYPARGVEEPEKDKTLRGSRDGFVETIVFNTALIRRRIRDPKLTMQIMSVGSASKTDVVVSYMKGRVDTKLLNYITKKIEDIQIDALTMNQESLAECLYRGSGWNPFPKFKYTERPDAAAASILEGSIVILVDNSPSAMVIPSTIFDIIQEADDYYFPPVTGTYLRISRMIMSVIAMLLTPTFVLLMQRPEFIPGWLGFIKVEDTVNVPLVLQFIILEFAIDGLKLASVNTPDMLSTPLSVVAGIVLGDYTVQSGWFNAEVMLYMAIVAISNYTQASFELGYAIKLFRIVTLILTGVFGLYGYIAGILFTVLSIVFTKTLAGKSYLYPLIPFNGRKLWRMFFRTSLPKSEGK